MSFDTRSFDTRSFDTRSFEGRMPPKLTATKDD
jgi:hypothetical protein